MRIALLLALVLAWGLPSVTWAQTPAPRVAAYDSLNVPVASQTVSFSKRTPKSGDRVDQTLRVELNLDSTVRQDNKEVGTSSTSMLREQQRTVIAEQVADGRTVAGTVRFAKCLHTVNGESDEPPVVGKTYRCERLDDDTLSVTRDDGSFASPGEFAIVSESMDALGRANPMADFLAGKTMTVGEKIEVPLEIGSALLGSNDALGTVSKFSLTLHGTSADGRIATFNVDLETQGSEKTQMRLMVNGQLLVEVDSCRTQRMTISGPLGMATTMGSYSTTQTTYVRGKLNVEMTAEYN